MAEVEHIAPSVPMPLNAIQIVAIQMQESSEEMLQGLVIQKPSRMTAARRNDEKVLKCISGGPVVLGHHVHAVPGDPFAMRLPALLPRL